MAQVCLDGLSAPCIKRVNHSQPELQSSGILLHRKHQMSSADLEAVCLQVVTNFVHSDDPILPTNYQTGVGIPEGHESTMKSQNTCQNHTVFSIYSFQTFLSVLHFIFPLSFMTHSVGSLDTHKCTFPHTFPYCAMMKDQHLKLHHIKST